MLDKQILIFQTRKYICFIIISHLNLYGRKEMFYLMMHATHFIYNYMASGIWYRFIQTERANPLHVLLFPISSKDSFIFIIPQTG